jgi:hypothetical protein
MRISRMGEDVTSIHYTFTHSSYMNIQSDSPQNTYLVFLKIKRKRKVPQMKRDRQQLLCFFSLSSFSLQERLHQYSEENSIASHGLFRS